MLTRLLKNNRSGGFLFIVILVLLLWLKSFISPTEHVPGTTMPLYNLLFGSIESSPVASSIVGLLIYTLLIILIYRLNVIHFLLEERSIMPSAFFIMISATFPSALHINPVLIGSVFLFFALLTIIKGEEHRAEPLSLFNGALLLALGSLFYLKLLYFIPFLWIAASIIRPLQWRGIVNPLLVLILFALFNFTYYWVFKDNLPLFVSIAKNNLLINSPFENFMYPHWILLGFLLFLVIISSIKIISRFQVRKIIIRKLYQVFFFLFIYALLFYILFSEYDSNIMPVIALPTSFLFSIVFNQKKSHWSRELLLWIWFGLLAFVMVTT